MAASLEIHAASVVVRGQFTPTIFQPSWFSSQGLISQRESETAEVELVHPKAAIFSVEWLQVRVLEGRFQASTNQEAYFQSLRDLVIGIFGILDQTPIKALGINQSFHFRLTSKEAWHSVGHQLVPKGNWDELLSEPGMRSLLVEGVRPDERDGYIRVQVEPSLQIPKHGLFFEVNDHYQLAKEDKVVPGTQEMLGILDAEWDTSMQRGSTITEQIASSGESS